MTIYNRWGEQVFKNEKFQPNLPSEGWNGEFKGIKMNPGVYVYVMEVIWNNGETQKLVGDITLVR